jgi:hypothetical protein
VPATSGSTSGAKLVDEAAASARYSFTAESAGIGIDHFAPATGERGERTRSAALNAPPSSARMASATAEASPCSSARAARALCAALLGSARSTLHQPRGAAVWLHPAHSAAASQLAAANPRPLQQGDCLAGSRAVARGEVRGAPVEERAQCSARCQLGVPHAVARSGARLPEAFGLRGLRASPSSVAGAGAKLHRELSSADERHQARCATRIELALCCRIVSDAQSVDPSQVGRVPQRLGAGRRAHLRFQRADHRPQSFRLQLAGGAGGRPPACWPLPLQPRSRLPERG